jgi:GNAT superfamily N-acetyltransferase
MIVQRLRLGEGEKIRALRLGALSDAPYAFGSSFAQEARYSAEHWDKLTEQSESGERGAVFVAADGARWLGMVGGHLREESPSVAIVWGMWVHASIRRHGFGRRLLQAVMDWAAARGAVRLDLSVTDRAPAAAALYRELGFTETGEVRPLASDPSINELLMTRSLEVGEGTKISS